MQAYSRCKLTYSKDKLIAILGLAQLFHSNLEDEYVVGMWRRELVQQLSWSVKQPTCARKYSNYVAPSWSWASIDLTLDGSTFHGNLNTLNPNISQSDGLISNGVQMIPSERYPAP